MKTITYLAFVLFSNICFSQKKEMMEAILKKQPEKAIEIGQNFLQTDPNSFETNFLFSKAYNEKNDFKNALIFIEKSKNLAQEDWQNSWILVESIQTYYGLGKIMEAKLAYQKAKQTKGTKNSESELKYWGIILGFDDIYKDWKIVESQNLIFHFQNSISDKKIKLIVKTRQEAFDNINSFFSSTLPKKIDFFVWDLETNFNPYLKKNLGFTKPEFCLSHNRLNQSAGHEITHSISHWRNPNNIKTRFINEGIGVYFDQNKTDKLKLAQKTNAMNPMTIKKMWENGNEVDESLLYTISGAFVEFLVTYNKVLFFKLSENQTYENAKIIYDGKIRSTY